MSPAEALAGRLVAVRATRGSFPLWAVWVADRVVAESADEGFASQTAGAWREAIARNLGEALPGGKEGRDLDPETVARARELVRDLEGHASLRVPVALELAALAPRLLAALDAACSDRDAAEGALADLLASEGRDLMERGRAEEREACAALVCWYCAHDRDIRYNAQDRRWEHMRPNDSWVRCQADQIRKRGPAPEPLPPASLRARVGAMEGVLRRLVAWAEEDRADAEQWAGIGALADAAREALGEGGHAEP